MHGHVVCRPRLLFQYLPYIQQEALRLDEQDIEAVLEATCGAGADMGAQSGLWGGGITSHVVTLHGSLAVISVISVTVHYASQSRGMTS